MKCTFLCKPGLAVCSLLINCKCFSSCTIFCLFKKIPKYKILKFDMKIILNSLYFGIIIFTCKLKLDHYDDKTLYCVLYRSADKSLARSTSRCILFDGENISFDAINSTNIPPIMIINKIY